MRLKNFLKTFSINFGNSDISRSNKKWKISLQIEKERILIVGIFRCYSRADLLPFIRISL